MATCDVTHTEDNRQERAMKGATQKHHVEDRSTVTHLSVFYRSHIQCCSEFRVRTFSSRIQSMENINYILDTPKGEGARVRSAADETAGEGDKQDVSEC